MKCYICKEKATESMAVGKADYPLCSRHKQEMKEAQKKLQEAREKAVPWLGGIRYGSRVR